MFHANAWALAFVGPMIGAKLVLPAWRNSTAPRLRTARHREGDDDGGRADGVAHAAAISRADWKELPHLKRVLIGGSACPRSMIEIFERKYEVEVVHAWGMTEMSPLGTLGTLKPGMDALPYEEQLAIKLKQGHPPFGVEMKIVDDEEGELPRDGKAFGRLKVRGRPREGYFKGEGERVRFGRLVRHRRCRDARSRRLHEITDRAKDVIKSGGEWISSIEIENVAVGHPAVAEAAVIGVAHPKWDERPLLIVVLKPGQTATKDEILKYLTGKIAKWWMPDDVAFVDEIPHTATGKIQKITLRQRFGSYRLPTAAE
jgi:acyl-CoA synthetase (AMP-forming)/AMP-acid ligase II